METTRPSSINRKKESVLRVQIIRAGGVGPRVADLNFADVHHVLGLRFSQGLP